MEPGARERDAFVLACRVYRTGLGCTGQPHEEWLRDALLAATSLAVLGGAYERGELVCSDGGVGLPGDECEPVRMAACFVDVGELACGAFGEDRVGERRSAAKLWLTTQA